MRAALSISPGATTDRPPAAARAVVQLVRRCPEARVDIMQRLAERLAALVRSGSYGDRWSSIDNVVGWIPYPVDAGREINRAAAVELETGPTVPGSFVYCGEET